MLKNYSYRLENVSFSYKNRLIIDRLSLSIPEGSVCAVMGPNGSGKTTLLHLLLGWLKPDNGRIYTGEKPLDSLGPRERGRMISLLPQMENLSFDYTVMEYILLGRAPYLKPLQQPSEEDRSIAEASLISVDGFLLKSRPMPSLSGGEMRISLMARSLTQQPEILLLDEPANHLDPARKRQILNVIDDFKKSKKTVIFTTHDPESVAGTADFLIMMANDGNIKYGSFEQIFTEENLSTLYGIAVRIIKLDDGRLTVTY